MDAPVSPFASTLTRGELLRWAATAAVLLLLLPIHLFAALLAGLLVHELVHALGGIFKLGAISRHGAKMVAVALLTVLVVLLLTAAVVGIGSVLRHGSDSLPALLQKLAEILENSRSRMPAWLTDSMPADADELRLTIVTWLRSHAGLLQTAGTNAGRAAAHILVGVVIGALLALREAGPARERGPLTRAITDSATRLSQAFRRVVFAQAWIAAINALFTGLYLAAALPMFGVHLPLAKTLIAITFVFGLVPILGNLLSNTVIVIVSLSDSLTVAVASLVFLLVIHKLEYFLNARIIGSHIRARAWELLLAMLVMDAVFGLVGVIAAPIYYAYVKDELARKQLI